MEGSARSEELLLKKPKRKQGPRNGKLKLGMRIVITNAP
jgi:hypothetical protein